MMQPKTSNVKDVIQKVDQSQPKTSNVKDVQQKVDQSQTNTSDDIHQKLNPYRKGNEEISGNEVVKDGPINLEARDEDDILIDTDADKNKTLKFHIPGREESISCNTESIKETRKVWSNLVSKVLSSRLSKVIQPDFITCTISNEFENEREDYVTNKLSLLSEEGVELDEDGYRHQIAELADNLSKAAVIPTSDEDGHYDDVDPEEMNLVFSVRREIATSVIYEKMLEGYVEQDIPCLKCGFPLMKYHATINCVVCPVLVKKIDNALKIRKEKFLKQKAEEAEAALKAAETKRTSNVETLEILKKTEMDLKAKRRLLVAASNVAEEQVKAAKEKYLKLQKEADEARKISSGAWNVAQEKCNQFKKSIEACEKEIELAVLHIEEVGRSRQEITKQMNMLIECAKEEIEEAEFRACEAQKDVVKQLKEVENATETLRLAVIAKEAADLNYKKCEDSVITFTNEVNSKHRNLKGLEKNREDAIKKADNELQQTIKKSSTIEQGYMKKVEEAQSVKIIAEESAKQRDECKMHKEAREKVAERVLKLAKQIQEQALDDCRSAEEELEKTKISIVDAIAKLEEDEKAIHWKEIAVRQKTAAAVSLRKELNKQILQEEAEAKRYIEEKMVVHGKVSSGSWDVCV